MSHDPAAVIVVCVVVNVVVVVMRQQTMVFEVGILSAGVTVEAKALPRAMTMDIGTIPCLHLPSPPHHRWQHLHPLNHIHDPFLQSDVGVTGRMYLGPVLHCLGRSLVHALCLLFVVGE